MRVFTKSGMLLAHDFERIVHGERGDYIEISQEQMLGLNIHIPKDKEWRLNHKKVYYIEFRSNDISNVMIYHQLRNVKYADYKADYFYVDPNDIELRE